MAYIEIEADEVEPIDVRLVGVSYLIRPPKSALTLGLAESLKGSDITLKKVPPLKKNATDQEKAEHEKLVEAYEEQATRLSADMLKMLNSWIRQAFGKEGAKAIHKRLKDEADLLDLPHLMKLMSKVAEVSTGNPTT